MKQRKARKKTRPTVSKEWKAFTSFKTKLEVLHDFVNGIPTDYAAMIKEFAEGMYEATTKREGWEHVTCEVDKDDPSSINFKGVPTKETEI